MEYSELKEMLQLLIDGDVNAVVLAMLHETSLQVAQKLGMSVRGAAMAYSIVAAHHEILKVVTGTDLNLLDAIEAEQQGNTMTVEDLLNKQHPGSGSEEERERFNGLLKDIQGL